MIGKRAKKRVVTKTKSENYYKILGLRSNASQERIKEKYIEQVKAFSPEAHPEEFQRIRTAYETLSDPIKRSGYDLAHKYGGKIERTMDKAYMHMGWGDLDTAEELSQEAHDLAPNNISIFLFRAHLALVQEDEQTFHDRIEQAKQLLPEKDRLKLLLAKACMLLDEEHEEEALSVLEEAQEFYPEEKESLKGLFVRVYQGLEQDDEMWDMLQSMIPSIDAHTPEHIHTFIKWINAMIDLEKWQEKAKIKTRLRKFIKSLKDEGDKLMVLLALGVEYEGYKSVGRFREAEMFIDAMCHINKDSDMREELEKTQKMMKLDKEIERMYNDAEMFPLVFRRAIELYSELSTPDRDISEVIEEIPQNHLEEFEKMDFEFAAGIIRVKKNYPLIYRQFREEWDENFKERTVGLNRDARRQLR